TAKLSSIDTVLLPPCMYSDHLGKGLQENGEMYYLTVTDTILTKKDFSKGSFYDLKSLCEDRMALQLSGVDTYQAFANCIKLLQLSARSDMKSCDIIYRVYHVNLPELVSHLPPLK